MAVHRQSGWSMRKVLAGLVFVAILSGCSSAGPGLEGGPCDEDGTCGVDALVCGPDRICHACGHDGQRCCAGDVCSEWHDCQPDGTCQACGWVHAPCCDTGVCREGSVCGVDGRCVCEYAAERHVSECDEKADWCDRADCVARIALAEGDMSLCNSFLLMRLEYCPYYECVDYVAKWTGDTHFCDDVSVAEVREWCIGTVAGATGNASLCAKIFGRNEIDHCLSEVAQATGDKSLCDQIHYNYWRGRCLQ